MKKTLSCYITEKPASYDIEIGSGLFKDRDIAEKLKRYGKRFAIVTSDAIANLYGRNFEDTLKKAGLEAHLISFPAGEQSKTRKTKEQIEDRMLEKGLSRDTVLIALGGGVVTDLGGFVASTYCRGIPLIIVPTTLMGMVDAGIGGKTGVNVSKGKNMIGSFYQPKKVLIDTDFLKSLPLEELKNGFVEMIKHGLIADRNYFAYLEKHSQELIEKDTAILQQAIFDSCRIKQEIVEKDEQESGLRSLLNYGHTVGHAYERLSNYSMPHGQAVAIGILIEGRMAVQMGQLSQNDFDRIQHIFNLFKISTKSSTTFLSEEVIQAMSHDKKSINNVPRVTILKGIGEPLIKEHSYLMEIDRSTILNAIQQETKV